jgi:hypothetical protein
LRPLEISAIVPQIPEMATTTMAESGNQGDKEMPWPSLEVASRASDIANLFFVISLVVGVMATIGIIWMANVKETYWDISRKESEEHIAKLTADGDASRASIAEANARAEEASQKAAEAQLALERRKTPRTLGPARQQAVAAAIKPFSGQRYRAAISQAADDGLAFWESLYVTLEKGGWVYVPPRFTFYVGGLSTSRYPVRSHSRSGNPH